MSRQLPSQNRSLRCIEGKSSWKVKCTTHQDNKRRLLLRNMFLTDR